MAKKTKYWPRDEDKFVDSLALATAEVARSVYTREQEKKRKRIAEQTN